MTITIEQIGHAYDYSKEVFAERLERKQAIDKLHELYDLNKNTARDFINQYEWMLRGQGEKFKRTMSYEAFEYYLNHIGNENGQDVLKVAIGAVNENIRYYEKTHGRMTKVRRLIELIERGLGESMPPLTRGGVRHSSGTGVTVGQVFSIAKLHYINGVVYFTAEIGETDLFTLAKHFEQTTKSGDVKHPEKRVGDLVRFAEGLGLVDGHGKAKIIISEIGKRFFASKADDKWSLSSRQKEILRNHILSNPSGSETIFSITSLLSLVQNGFQGKELEQKYASAIGKEEAWKSDVTFERFTKFGLSYLDELGFMDEEFSRNNQGFPVTEAQYQRAVREQATSNNGKNYKEPAGVQPPQPKINSGGTSRFQRNSAVAAEALRKANFKCEILPEHKTLISSSKIHPYLEAHHLVPISNQDGFDASLDVLANVVALCPLCHKLLHHGRAEDKKDFLSKLYSERKTRLSEKGILVDEKTLCGYYSRDLLEEDA